MSAPDDFVLVLGKKPTGNPFPVWNAQREAARRQVLFIDLEGTYDGNWKAALGVP